MSLSLSVAPTMERHGRLGVLARDRVTGPVEMLARWLLDAPYEPLAFFTGVFFLWLLKPLYLAPSILDGASIRLPGT